MGLPWGSGGPPGLLGSFRPLVGAPVACRNQVENYKARGERSAGIGLTVRSSWVRSFMLPGVAVGAGCNRVSPACADAAPRLRSASPRPAPVPGTPKPNPRWPRPSSVHARIGPAPGSAPGERKGVQTQPSEPGSSSTHQLVFSIDVAPISWPSCASAPLPLSHPLSRPWILTLGVFSIP